MRISKRAKKKLIHSKKIEINGIRIEKYIEEKNKKNNETYSITYSVKVKLLKVLTPLNK